MENVAKLDAKSDPNKAAIRSALEGSAGAIAKLLETAIADGGKVQNFKAHATAFLGYLISHESHHRGQIGWAVKYSGHPLDQKTAFGLWAWGVRWVFFLRPSCETR